MFTSEQPAAKGGSCHINEISSAWDTVHDLDMDETRVLHLQLCSQRPGVRTVAPYSRAGKPLYVGLRERTLRICANGRTQGGVAIHDARDAGCTGASR
jgi:hypothetical protein